jgi:fluoride exporter
MMTTLFSVALGGAIGASLRYGAGVWLFRAFGPTGFPLGVISVNIVGSFLMGVLVVLAAHKGLTHLNPFLAIGVLGGFTTFSSFSLEAVNLIEKGQFAMAGAYVALSVILSIAGLMLGLWCARGVWA